MIEAHIKITWKTVGLAVAALVVVLFVVGLVQEVGSLLRNHRQAKSNTGAAKAVANADFAYLVPALDSAWTFDASSVVSDQAKGVVKYQVVLKPSNVNITISQQQLPSDLTPRGSDKFQAFIQSEKPVQFQLAGAGIVYFLPALENGSPAKGADTVIYATDTILLFGRSSTIVDYDTWAKLTAAMRPTAKP